MSDQIKTIPLYDTWGISKSVRGPDSDKLSLLEDDKFHVTGLNPDRKTLKHFMSFEEALGKAIKLAEQEGLRTRSNGNTGIPTPGSEADLTELRAKLEAWQNTLAAIEEGAMSPQSILGYRGSKKEARRVANGHIQDLEEQIARLEKDLVQSDESGRDNNEDVFGQAFPEFSGKPDEAIAYLLKEKKGYVPAAFHKEGIGDIDLVWGNSKFGIEHIIERRTAQGLDGMTFVKELPELIASGRVERDKNDPDTAFVVNDTRKAVVALKWESLRRTWLVTAYPQYENIQSAGSNTPLNQPVVDGQNPPSNSGDGNNLNSDVAFVNDLNDIIAGKYDGDTDKIDQLLDQAAAQAESAGQFEANEGLFNEAADHLTELLKAKAGNI